MDGTFDLCERWREASLEVGSTDTIGSLPPEKSRRTRLRFSDIIDEMGSIGYPPMLYHNIIHFDHTLLVFGMMSGPVHISPWVDAYACFVTCFDVLMRLPQRSMGGLRAKRPGVRERRPGICLVRSSQDRSDIHTSTNLTMHYSTFQRLPTHHQLSCPSLHLRSLPHLCWEEVPACPPPN